MIVAKLSTDKVVQLLKPARQVQFASGLWVLVCDRLTEQPGHIDPYWAPASIVVWKMEFC